MNWIFLSILTPFLYSFTNVIEKYLIDKKIKDSYFFTILGGIVYGVVGFVLLILGGTHIDLLSFSLVFLSGLFLTFYLIPYFEAIKLEDISLIMILFGITPLFSLLFSYLFLGEVLTNNQLFAFGIMFVGAMILGTEGVNIRDIRIKKALWYVLIGSIIYALIGVLFKSASQGTHILTLLGYQGLGSAAGSLLILCFTSKRNNFIATIKGANGLVWGLLIANELFNLAAEMIASYVVTIAPVALVTIIESTAQPLFVILEGLLLSLYIPHVLKENISRQSLVRKIISFLLIGYGVWLIYI